MLSSGLYSLPSEDVCPRERKVEKVRKSKKRRKTSSSSISKQRKLTDFTESKVEGRLNEWYWVSKSQINVTEHKNNLTVAPKQSGFSNIPVQPFEIFRETKTELGVPRFYGYDNFGPPKVTEVSRGEPMAPEVKFAGSLRDTEQYPQQSAVDQWVHHSGCGLLALACGLGKTVCATYCAVIKKRKTLILVHEDHLVRQWEERLRQFVPNARIGYLVQNKVDIYDKDFVIGMIPSVARRDYPDLDTFGTLIIDEAHHLAARTFCQSVPKLRPRYILALSATPDRNDGLTRVIHWLAGPLFFQAEQKHTNPIQITQAVYTTGNHKEISYRGGKPAFALMIRRLINDPKRNALIFRYVRELFEKESVSRIMLVSERRKHLEYLHGELVKRGYDCGLYMGSISAKKLEEAKTKPVICASYGLASEALDIKGLNGMILCTPWGRTQQVAGRLREDKQASQRYIYDIVDPFSLFEAMSWKRHRLYKKLGYYVRREEVVGPTFFA